MMRFAWVRVSALLLSIGFLIIVLANGAVAEPFRPKVGTHYDLITPPMPVSGTKPEVVEVFNFKCPHCYKLHPRMTAWSLTMKERMEIVSLPIAFSNQSDYPVRAFFTAQFMGKGEAMKHALFKAQFVDHMNIDSPSELAFIAGGVELDAIKFQANLTSFSVDGKLVQGRQLSEGYGVHSTPTLVVNGRYRVIPGKHDQGDEAMLFAIVEALATQ